MELLGGSTCVCEGTEFICDIAEYRDSRDGGRYRSEHDMPFRKNALKGTDRGFWLEVGDQ